MDYKENGEENIKLPVNLRDYFAAKAMQGILSEKRIFAIADIAIHSKNIANASYFMADAMMEEMKK